MLIIDKKRSIIISEVRKGNLTAGIAGSNKEVTKMWHDAANRVTSEIMKGSEGMPMTAMELKRFEELIRENEQLKREIEELKAEVERLKTGK